jgi:REP element-mobilizing transposase RayT
MGGLDPAGKRENGKGRGGPRPGSGPKKKQWRKGAPHRVRLSPDGWRAHHVTLSRKPGLPLLRTKEIFFFTLETLRALKEREDFRLVAWTLQRNHLHLLVEVPSRRALSRNLQGLQVRLAKGWNRIWGRRGKVFAGRFFSRLIEGSHEGRKVLAYVLKNHLRHGLHLRSCVDPAGSALWMDVWLEREAWLKERKRFKVEEDPSPVSPPRTEVLRRAVFPGSLGMHGRPSGYSRDEFLPRREVEKERETAGRGLFFG